MNHERLNFFGLTMASQMMQGSCQDRTKKNSDKLLSDIRARKGHRKKVESLRSMSLVQKRILRRN
ncbi:unnamed protein product [Linum tenue]|uniref:Uncharacterized protein n=1 Tax=Linum tenue TaxID=586396 RepID=A0AAV0NDW9_9ROSI|nr:unnamed protein product [Linum tenue]